MSNLIVIVVLLLIVAWAVKESAKHLHGEGGCCGGGDGAPFRRVTGKGGQQVTEQPQGRRLLPGLAVGQPPGGEIHQ